MHDPTLYRATFNGLIMTAFGKEQVLKLRIQLTMYQVCDSPARWSFTPTLPTGRPHMHAPSPIELARAIEETFVTRETDWTANGNAPLQSWKGKPINVVPIDQKRRAAR